MKQKIAIAFALIVLFLTACGGGGGGSSAPGNTNNNSTLTELVAMGVPEDVAQFFVDAKLTSSCSSNTNCTFNYTYPNGATRTITMTAIPNQTYTPTADELAMTALEALPVYNASFTATGIDDVAPPPTSQVNLGYFLPTTSIPSNKSSALALPAGSKTSLGFVVRAPGVNNGFQINWNESGTKGADVAIGSILEHYKDLGRPVEVTGSIYAVASALSDVASAMALSQEINAMLAELNSLEECASDPTNPLTQSDPNYTADTVARVQATRAELKQLSAARFLNLMDETASGLTPVSAALSIPLKQANSYVEQTLKNVSESLMRDIRESVVSCKPTCPTSLVATGVSESQIDLSWAGSIGDYVVTGYNISGVGVTPTTTATFASATGLARSTNYCYTVTAYNDYGTAENCPEACAQTMGPPVVISSTPYAGSTNVPVTTTVTATFSEAMDAATLTTGTFTLTGSSAVAGTVSYSGNTATFTPSSDLEKGKTYTATITTGVTDLDGIAMEANFSWSFTTEGSATAGNVTFNNNVNGFNATNGTATVSWNLIEDTGDTRTYEATGTISADVGYDGCNSVTVTTNLITNSHLVIYTASNALAPNTYFFGLVGTQFSVTLNCGGDSVPVTGVIGVPVATCGVNFEPQPISDYTHLAGSYSCLTDFSHNNVTWDFDAL